MPLNLKSAADSAKDREIAIGVSRPAVFGPRFVRRSDRRFAHFAFTYGFPAAGRLSPERD